MAWGVFGCRWMLLHWQPIANPHVNICQIRGDEMRFINFSAICPLIDVFGIVSRANVNSNNEFSKLLAVTVRYLKLDIG